MNKRNKSGIILSCLAVILFSSCLKSGLPSYPLYNLNYINRVYFEYRWADSSNLSNGNPVVAIKPLNVTQTIDSVNNMINLQVTVPGTNGDFDAYQRSQVALNHLWCSIDISPAAAVAPDGNSPKLGYVGDFSIPQKYKVVAANGSARVWTLTVTSFTK